MRRHMLLFAVVLCLIGADRPPEGDARKDLEGLEGTWSVVETTFDGKAVEEKALKGRKLIFRGKEFTAVSGDKRTTLTFTLDPSKKPKQIDLRRAGKDEVAHGIYELDGDELKLCYGEPGAERPGKFASPAGDKVFLLVLKRDKR